MLRRAIWALVVVMCLAAPIAVHAQGDYLEVFIVKVKPEKVADFEAITKKWADANRKHGGDTWIALETQYGEGNVYQFTSTRKDYADIDKSMDVGMTAANKAFGKEIAKKMERDFQNCLVWSRTELRRRRWDLSSKPPTDAAAYAKLIGESRVLRTTAVHIRPGHVPDFEAMLKEIKEAADKDANVPPSFVSQVVEGTKGATFYVSSLRTSLGGFDKNPTLREILGEENYKKFQHMNAEAVEEADSMLLRFSPELSNPPEEVASASADFWHPKAAMSASAAKSKAATAKSAEMKPAAEKQSVPEKKP
jgi:hypothetical protein